MNKKVFFILLLVLTIGFSACKKENDPIEENPYATLSQSEIVSLLNESWLKSMNAVEYRKVDSMRNRVAVEKGLVGLNEFNQNQKKSLVVNKTYEGQIYQLIYNENFTRFSYHFEPEWMPEPIQTRTRLSEYFWYTPHYISISTDYEDYTWSVEGRVFTGVSQEKTCIVKLNKNEQLISVTRLFDMSYWSMFTTFSYENINPIFPQGFNKDDFIETE